MDMIFKNLRKKEGILIKYSISRGFENHSYFEDMTNRLNRIHEEYELRSVINNAT